MSCASCSLTGAAACAPAEGAAPVTAPMARTKETAHAIAGMRTDPPRNNMIKLLGSLEPHRAGCPGAACLSLSSLVLDMERAHRAKCRFPAAAFPERPCSAAWRHRAG